MKKYLLLFVGLLLTAPYSEAEAKAVKFRTRQRLFRRRGLKY